MRKPNILFIFADQFRKQALGFMQQDQVITPNIDKFSQEALVFKNAVSSCPLCSPYRACMFTGKYPLSNGVFTNCKTGLDIMLKENDICLSDILYNEGYTNGYIGKWHLDNPEMNECSKPLSGAVDWDAYTPPGAKRHHFDFWYSYGADDNHFTPHYWKDTHEQIKINKWSVEHETDVAIEYINKHKDEQFALFLAYNPPHSPYNLVPNKYMEYYKDTKIKFRENVVWENIHCHTSEKFDYTKEDLELITKQYFAAITGIDENFGRIIQSLKDNNIEDDTLIIFSADHGDMLGSHELMAKHVWYEESIGVPFIMKWKNSSLITGTTDIVFESTDIMPTMLKLIGVNYPDTVEGKDISNIITSNNEISSQNKYNSDKVAFLSAFPGRDIFLEEFKKQNKNPKDFGWRAIRTQDYTFVIDLGYLPQCTNAHKFLYDLKKDIYQLNPIEYENAEYKEIINDLEKRLIEWLKSQNDGILKN